MLQGAVNEGKDSFLPSYRDDLLRRSELLSIGQSKRSRTRALSLGDLGSPDRPQPNCAAAIPIGSEDGGIEPLKHSPPNSHGDGT